MSERTRAIIEEDLKDFQKYHSRKVAVLAGIVTGLAPGIVAASHNTEPFVFTAVTAIVITGLHLDISGRALASLQEELKKIGT